MSASVAGDGMIGAPVGIEVQEQFHNASQQKRAAEMGMWAWLLTELLLFGALFCIALVLHTVHPDSVRAAVRRLNLTIGAINSVVLICSSLTMSGAIMMSRLGAQRWMVRCMLATAALGVLFLLLKSYEWYTDYAEYLTPFLSHRPYALPDDAPSRLFINLYFCATILHGVHLLTGVSILGYLTWRGSRPGFLATHQNWIEIYGLYWHFIDLVWIIVFPVLYVVGR